MCCDRQTHRATDRYTEGYTTDTQTHRHKKVTRLNATLTSNYREKRKTDRRKTKEKALVEKGMGKISV